jgi:FtsZ-binding cell division protein ZapB
MRVTASSYECDEYYEISSREKFRLVIYKTLNILVKESREELDIEIDILGQVNASFKPSIVQNDPDTRWNVIILKETTNLSHLNTEIDTNINDETNTGASVSDSPEKVVEGIDPLEVVSQPKFKYVIGEVTAGGKGAVLSKVDQLEKDCFFICSKASNMKDGSLDSSSRSRVSDVVCFVVLIAPHDNALLVSESIRSKRLTCPFVYQLFCEGRFVYIVNKDTTVEVLKKLEQESADIKQESADIKQESADIKQESADIKQELAGFKQKLEHLSNNMEEVKELLSEILTEMKRVLVRISIKHL